MKQILSDADVWALRRKVRKQLDSQEDRVFCKLCEIKPIGGFRQSIYEMMRERPDLWMQAVDMIYGQARGALYALREQVSDELINEVILLKERLPVTLDEIELEEDLIKY